MTVIDTAGRSVTHEVPKKSDSPIKLSSQHNQLLLGPHSRPDEQLIGVVGFLEFNTVRKIRVRESVMIDPNPSAPPRRRGAGDPCTRGAARIAGTVTGHSWGCQPQHGRGNDKTQQERDSTHYNLLRVVAQGLPPAPEGSLITSVSVPPRAAMYASIAPV